MLSARTKARLSLSEFQIWALELLLFNVGLDTRLSYINQRKSPATALGASSLRQDFKEESGSISWD